MKWLHCCHNTITIIMMFSPCCSSNIVIETLMVTCWSPHHKLEYTTVEKMGYQYQLHTVMELMSSSWDRIKEKLIQSILPATSTVTMIVFTILTHAWTLLR